MDKKIVELFAGVGGFRLGFDRLGTGWETVWFSQWEPGKKNQWAHECYVSHFGDSPDLNGNYTTGIDISNVIKDTIPNHTLLVGGFPCLTGETLVLTNRGVVPISEVTTKDKVMSHDGKLHQVLNVFDQGTKPTYNVSGYAFDAITATANHKFYVRERYFTYDNKARNKHFTEPVWMSVQDMLSKEFKNIYFGNKINEDATIPEWDGIEINLNQFNKEIRKTLDMSDEILWYLVGRYLGDGWLRKQQKKGELRQPFLGVTICCGKHKADHFEERISTHFKYTKAEERTVYKYYFSSAELAAFMMQFGRGAENKHLPYFVQSLPVNLLKALIDGYFDSDGCKIDNRLQFTTVSKRLAYDIASALEKVYHKPCQIYLTKTSDTMKIEGRTVNQKDYYIVRCIMENVHKSAFYEDGFIWYPLKKISKGKEEHVYDIEVADTHSFIANRAVTHNCQDYSIAHSLSSSKGIEGKKGVLWWQIRDTMIAKKPPFCIFENVDRLLKSPAKQRGRDFGIILACLADLGYSVEWRVVNAAQYGAAQRRRRVFIFAYRNDLKYAQSEISPEDRILSEGFMAKAFPVTDMGEIKEVTLPEDVVEISDSFSFGFEKAGYMTGRNVYTASVTEDEIPPILLKDIVEGGADERFYIPAEKLSKWEYLKGAKKINRTSASGYQYVFSEGPVAFPDPLDRPGRTMLTSESTLNRSTHVVSDPQTGRLRLLTPVEAERLQGFDDNWTNTGMPVRMRYFCMGNALVVQMITRMGKILDDIIENE